MKKPYLIQRCMLKKEKEGRGFDGRFRLDYMGSSEFEWGSIPASLKQFTRNVDALSIVEVGIKNYKGQGMWAICLPAVWEEYKAFMPDLGTDKLPLKESIYLKEQTTGKDWDGKPLRETSFKRVDLWWDIDNHVMFAYGKDIIKTLKTALVEVRDYKKAENHEGWF